MGIDEIVKKVRSTIAENKLFTAQDRLLVAVSGGADSMMLLHFLHAEGYAVEAVHCNFRLRGEESDRDESLVRDFCESYDIPLTVYPFDTREYAREKGISLEMAARDLRYEVFERHRKEKKCRRIVVAHHANDNVETVLYHLIRGTGLHGLTGMEYLRGAVARPLLDIFREDVKTYVEANAVPYVVDSSNLVDDVARNKLRLNVIPEMEKILPSAVQQINKAIGKLREAEFFYRRGLDVFQMLMCEDLKKDGKDVSELRFSFDGVKKGPWLRTALYDILSGNGFNEDQVNQIYSNFRDGQSGKVYESPGYRLLRDRSSFVLQNRHEIVPRRIVEELRFEMYDTYVPPKDGLSFALDADKVASYGDTFTTRLCRKGDRFIPFGMKGYKLVSDFLTDRKYSLFEKEEATVICCGDTIVAVVNERIDNRFRVRKDTKNVVLLLMV
jgi:tRNA(Ile)-lysidine synthase